MTGCSESGLFLASDAGAMLLQLLLLLVVVVVMGHGAGWRRPTMLA